MRDALVVELASADRLVAAIEAMREHGHRDLDAYTPYPVHDVEHALGLRRSRLPLAAGTLGLLAAATAYGAQWLLNAYLYPLNVGGRPPHFPLPFVIITFEMGVLVAAFAAFFGALGLARLPRLWHPIDEVPGFERATRDRYWLVVHVSTDGDRLLARRHLGELEALRVVSIVDGRVE